MLSNKLCNDTEVHFIVNNFYIINPWELQNSDITLDCHLVVKMWENSAGPQQKPDEIENDVFLML